MIELKHVVVVVVFQSVMDERAIRTRTLAHRNELAGCSANFLPLCSAVCRVDASDGSSGGNVELYPLSAAASRSHGSRPRSLPLMLQLQLLLLSLCFHK